MSLSVEKNLRKAQSHLKAGEFAEAETLYKAILLKFPVGRSRSDLLFQMGLRMLADVRVQYAAENMQHMSVSI